MRLMLDRGEASVYTTTATSVILLTMVSVGGLASDVVDVEGT